MNAQSEGACDFRRDAQSGFRLFETLVAVHIATLTPFLRIGFGKDYPGVSGLLAVPLLILVAAEARDPGVLNFAVLWFVLLLVQRSWMFMRHHQGHYENANYDGRPWLAMLIPCCKAEERARNVEPFLCLPMGCLLMPFAPGVGMYVMAGFLSLWLNRRVALMMAEHQRLAVQNLRVDQKTVEQQLQRRQASRSNQDQGSVQWNAEQIRTWLSATQQGPSR